MKKVLLGLFFVCFSAVTQAEPALYKKIALNKVNVFTVNGNFDVELRKGDVASLALYIRESRENEVRVSIKEVKNGNELSVIEKKNSDTSVLGQQTIASLILTLPDLNYIKLSDVYHFNLQDFDTERLSIKASKRSNVTLDMLTINQLKLILYDKSKVVAESLDIEKLLVSQTDQSQIELNRSILNSGELKLRKLSQFQANDIQGQLLGSTLYNDSKLVLDANTHFNSVVINNRNSSQVNAEYSQLNLVDVIAKNSAKIHLGVVQNLNVSAFNNAKVDYTSVGNISKTNKHASTVNERKVKEVIDE